MGEWENVSYSVSFDLNSVDDERSENSQVCHGIVTAGSNKINTYGIYSIN